MTNKDLQNFQKKIKEMESNFQYEETIPVTTDFMMDESEIKEYIIHVDGFNDTVWAKLVFNNSLTSEKFFFDENTHGMLFVRGAEQRVNEIYQTYKNWRDSEEEVEWPWKK